MQALLAALAYATVSIAGFTAEAPAAGPEKAHVIKVQGTLSWSGSWIYIPEIRKGITKDNHSSIELLMGNKVNYCLNGSCWKVGFTEKNQIYRFVVPSIIPTYYEFWLGDFNSLEGRSWFGKTKPQGAPDAMIRMMHP
ncbi:hypothetical protein [Jiella sonneratiae]|uniref:Uncharacterized protein n=1 Tax=Jiella sonneratiae TaxID=2816856 RepID=A0ABS3J1M3_9HYPH|nr:hypothetical protein [Jiella sonneratiae]MBO0903572.1 hypothetical protein [Jiella sonneratiae]